jgi:hypothetical protein
MVLEKGAPIPQFPALFLPPSKGQNFMRGFKAPSFTDRLNTAAKAQQERLAKAKALAPQNDPEFAKRQEARRLQAEEREARLAQRKAEKLARETAEAEAREAARIAAEEAARVAEEARKIEEAERVEREALERRAIADREVALEAERKTARDARYAARKARQK